MHMDLDHCRVVQGVLAGTREQDEQAQVSLGILAERLERLKRAYAQFSGVGFSPDAKVLLSRSRVPVS